MNKAAAEKENFQDIQSTNISPYQNRQASGRVLKKLARLLPQSPPKKRLVLAKTAKEIGLTISGQPSCQYQKSLSNVTLKLITDYYCKMKFHGKPLEEKIVLLFKEVTSSGEKVKKIIQSRYLLMSLKEAYHLFKS